MSQYQKEVVVTVSVTQIKMGVPLDPIATAARIQNALTREFATDDPKRWVDVMKVERKG